MRAGRGVRRRSCAVSLGVAAVCLVAGCGGSSRRVRIDRPVALTVTAAERSASPVRRSGELRVISPAAGQSVASSFVVRVRLRGVRLASGLGRPGDELQICLDGGRFDESPFSADGRLALEQAVNGFYSPAFRQVMAYRSIPAGGHRLVVRLATGTGRVISSTSAVHFTVR